MRQKSSNYQPMTDREIEIINMDIPERSVSAQVKEEMVNAVSKIHAKLHLMYTMGI